eukprot:scaffold123122_cov64-Attheya_sp.AAC.3
MTLVKSTSSVQENKDRRLAFIFPRKPSFVDRRPETSGSPRSSLTAGLRDSLRRGSSSLSRKLRKQVSSRGVDTKSDSTSVTSLPSSIRITRPASDKRNALSNTLDVSLDDDDSTMTAFPDTTPTRDEEHDRRSPPDPSNLNQHFAAPRRHHRRKTSGTLSSCLTPHHQISELGSATILKTASMGSSVTGLSNVSDTPDPSLLGNRTKRMSTSHSNAYTQIKVGAVVGVSGFSEDNMDDTKGPMLTESEMEFNEENRDFWGDYNYEKENAFKTELKYVIKTCSAPFVKLNQVRLSRIRESSNEDFSKVSLMRSKGTLA